MGLFKYLDSITPKIYILSIGNEITIAKIGYTKKEIEKRIKDYKFSGEWKGKESEIKIHAIFENPKAEAIEDVMRKTKNVNMSERRTPEVTSKGGMKIKAVSTPSSRGLKIRSKNNS